MRIAKYRLGTDTTPWVGVVEDDRITPIGQGYTLLTELIEAEDLEDRVRKALSAGSNTLPLETVQLLAPMDHQEVWGAGVTYERSKVARQEESEQGATFYDLVYRADRPELFFKATPSRVAGPGQLVRVRRDSNWSVPEPELALVLSSSLRLVGFTVGNDMSARDIEGVNPLYLPQAKVYDACCGLGPTIRLASTLSDPTAIEIQIEIERNSKQVFHGKTSTAKMARTFGDLIQWLGRDSSFPHGVILLTGTGIVPPDEFSLKSGDVVKITMEGIGTLINPVIQGGS